MPHAEADAALRVVFERASNVQLTGQPNVHYQQGSPIGNAFP
jgi:hypothetical protein